MMACSCESGRVACPSCNGEGWDEGGFNSAQCSTCNGSGVISCPTCEDAVKNSTDVQKRELIRERK